MITTEHDAAASGKSRKRKAAEALLNRIHLAADSGAQKKQKASVVSYCCCVIPWVVSIKLWPPSASQQCLSPAELCLCAGLPVRRQPACMAADALRSANT